MSRACEFHDTPDGDLIHCSVCRNLIEVGKAIIADDLSEVCSRDCEDEVRHQHCNHHPCIDCMEKAQEKAESREER
jgi:hypothetical protein